jgi:predicted phage-related endonuclease
VEEIDRFWIDNILGGKEPDAINPKDVMLKYVRHTDGKVVECSEEVFEEYQELKEVKERLDEMEEKKEALEGKIKMAFGDAEALSYGGSTICTWKAPKAGLTFDSKTFQAEHPDIAKQYMIPRQRADSW